MGKKIKKLQLETKLLGYIIMINGLVMVNIIFAMILKCQPIPELAITMTKFILLIGLILLLGRKAIAEIVVRIFGKVVTK